MQAASCSLLPRHLGNSQAGFWGRFLNFHKSYIWLCLQSTPIQNNLLQWTWSLYIFEHSRFSMLYLFFAVFLTNLMYTLKKWLLLLSSQSGHWLKIKTRRKKKVVRDFKKRIIYSWKRHRLFFRRRSEWPLLQKCIEERRIKGRRIYNIPFLKIPYGFFFLLVFIFSPLDLQLLFRSVSFSCRLLSHYVFVTNICFSRIIVVFLHPANYPPAGGAEEKVLSLSGELASSLATIKRVFFKLMHCGTKTTFLIHCVTSAAVFKKNLLCKALYRTNFKHNTTEQETSTSTLKSQSYSKHHSSKMKWAFKEEHSLGNYIIFTVH